ncbi:LPS assembly lipoprotein LptE [uncultured Roseobacter sp.]|uniref:LPS assembly lipoprotein LptE n=1 Tax=uncultured Roseobacter sp. TaxID=114847 RepID=UPI002606F72F|nr:LPS assembly lipoprotein LptE [uncultured Roseobacter sp.]
MLSFSRKFLLMIPLALAACGFTPVYAPGGTGAQLQNSITVQAPNTRDEFLLTQRLEERLGRASEAPYALNYTLRSSRANLAVDSEGSTTRFNIIGSADYSLVETGTGRVIASDRVDNFTGYSAAGTTVATLAAERDAQQRLMILLADQIVTRILTTDLQ